MELGMIGLGRMGAHMTTRLIQGGHRVFAYDRQKSAVEGVVASGAVGADSLDLLIAAIAKPRVVWMMLPAGSVVDETINQLSNLLTTDDILIDGGNSYYRDSVRRADALRQRGIHFVDVGTSGGIWGLKSGYSLMIGGAADAVQRLTPAFQALAPGADKGWAHVGPAGSGHFVKMVHNGIEYGLMQAYAEGFALLEAKKEFQLDLAEIAEVWRHGSVVRSWLLDLAAEALAENPTLKGIAPYVEDSGEGRWMVSEAIDRGVPCPVITQSLIERIRSRV